MDLLKQCKGFVNEIVEAEMDGYKLNIVRQNVLTFINEQFNERIDMHDAVLSYIAADCATVEVIDDETGLCFRRELPLRYEETGNGVSLIGEDITGKASQISFLSETAYEKIKDLTGKGSNAPVCKEHI